MALLDDNGLSHFWGKIKSYLSTNYLGKSANAGSATKLQTARTISLTGDATGSASFDGSQDISIPVTVESGGGGEIQSHASTHASTGTDPITPASIGAAAQNHDHQISDVTGLQSALDGKAQASHSHAISEVSGLQTALDGKSGSDHTHAPASIGAAIPSVGVSVELSVSLWTTTTLAQTVSVSGVTATNNVIVSPSPESHTAWCEAGVYCSSQSDGELTFKCATIPTAILTANVLIVG